MTKKKNVLPVIARIQEAYRNLDGTYSPPHWDQVFSPRTEHLLVDHEEIDDHLLHIGAWTEMYTNLEDDPRPGCRRLLDVQWDPKDRCHCATVPVVKMSKHELVYDKLLDFVRSVQADKLIECNCGIRTCEGTCTFARMNKVLDDAGFSVVRAV